MYDNIQLNDDEVCTRCVYIRLRVCAVPVLSLCCAAMQPFPLQAGVDNFIANLVKKVRVRGLVGHTASPPTRRRGVYVDCSSHRRRMPSAAMCTWWPR